MRGILKDTLREIRKRYKIFLSILFMALLGVGFFAGIRATTPNMQNTIDSYFRDLNVMDIHVMSLTGFTSDDIEKLKEIEEVQDISLVNQIDTIATVNDKDYAFTTITYDSTINDILLTSGRLPKDDTECVIDSNIKNVNIGDIITLKTEDPRYKNKELKVVGFANSPLYVSKDRGTTKLASGTIDYFLYMQPDNILGNIYTDMYITLHTDDNLFSDDYQEYVDKVVNKIEQVDNHWYVFDINENTGFTSFADDTYRIENIAKIFPIIFFVVAVLISLTSMTRMIEEQRVQIGTLKALGYTNTRIASKYIIYATLATLVGGFIGILIGVNIIPRIIYAMYQMMYNTKDLIVEYNWPYSLLGLAIAYICIIGAVIYACFKEMLNHPATLMRPKAPKAGKRVFLERIYFIWKRLSFTNKVTCRNMFRYKKRFLMTIIGIMGCTALIFAGFGLKDSVSSMLPLQYGHVFKYDLQVIFSHETSNTEIDLFDHYDDISSYAIARMESTEIQFKDNSNSDVQIVVVDPNTINDYILLDADSNCFQDGILLTEKIAKLLGIKVGDTVTIINTNQEEAEVKVSKIVENYLRHYIYMDQSKYQELFHTEAKYNVAFVKIKDLEEVEEDDIASSLLQSDAVSKVVLTSDVSKVLDDTLDNMNYVVWILIVSAGILALTVLYNLSNVNISERKRELATIKVLGFYDKEVYNYVSKENTVLTMIGIILGLGMGYFLTLVIIKTCELDILLFPSKVKIWSYIISVVLTIVFTIIVQIMNYFTLKKIDMIESLKSVE